MTNDAAKPAPRYITWSLAETTALVRFRYIQVRRFEEYNVVEEELLAVLTTPGVTALVLNFEVIEHFTSRMLGVLAALSRRVQATGQRLAVCRLRPEPLRAYQVTKMDTLIPCYPSEEEARAAVTEPLTQKKRIWPQEREKNG